jgi:hypothetical protein
MGNIVRLLAFMVVLVCPALARAYDVAVMPVKGVNLKPGQPEAIGVILAQQYAKASAYQVAVPDVTTPVLAGGTDYSAATKSLGAGEYLETVAVSLDAKLVLSVERHDHTGKLVHSASMTGVTLDDVPELAARISRALLLRTSTDETRTLDTVTAGEATPTTQTSTVVPKGIKSSLVLPLAKGVTLEPMASIAFELRIEKRDYFFGFAGGMMLPSDSSTDSHGYGGLFAELSGNYFLTHTNFAPYVGAGLSPRIQITNRSAVGFAPFAHIGAMFPRESRARVLFDLRVAQNVFPLPGTTADYYDFNTGTYVSTGDPRKGKYPTELSAQFGVVW